LKNAKIPKGMQHQENFPKFRIRMEHGFEVYVGQIITIITRRIFPKK
jgi:hypothetical protein